MSKISFLKIVEKVFPGKIGESIQAYRISKSPDRIILGENIIYSIIKQKEIFNDESGVVNVLWIGTRLYTKKYTTSLSRNGFSVYTTDIDDYAKKYGTEKHKTLNAINIDNYYDSNFFDIVIFNGVLGWGINKQEDQRKSIESIFKITKPSGWLSIGWNTNKMLDPLFSGICDGLFEHTKFPGLNERIITYGHSHVYDFFQKNDF